jgi:hypothetical protein
MSDTLYVEKSEVIKAGYKAFKDRSHNYHGLKINGDRLVYDRGAKQSDEDTIRPNDLCETLQFYNPSPEEYMGAESKYDALQFITIKDSVIIDDEKYYIEVEE